MKYCIESPEGKHSFIPNELIGEGHICKYCFLPPEKCKGIGC